MNMKRLASRVKHLQLRIKSGECDGCIRTAMMQVAASSDSSLSAPSSCPEFGNPNPRILMWVIDEITSDEEQMVRVEKQIRDRNLKEHPEWWARPRK